MIVGLYGDIGSGKTINGIRFLKELSDKGYKIYSNITLLDIPYTNLTLDDLLDIVEYGKIVNEPEVYFIDEIILWGLDSRTGSSKISRILSYFLLQTRKLSHGKEYDIGTYFIYTTQYPDLIDKRLWIATTIKISHFKHKTTNGTFIIRYWYIKKLMKIIQKIDLFKADNYFKYYDTKEIVRIQKTDRYNKKTDLSKYKTQKKIVDWGE
jgi:hypothetical protein